MTQSAVVRRRLSGDKVEILVRRVSACGHDCAGCGGCPSMVREPEVTAVAEDTLGVRPGQRVRVESSTRRVLGLAALLYLFPFVVFFAAYLLLSGASDGVAALGAVGGFLAALLGICLPLERYIRRRKAVTFRIVAVEG